MPSSPPHRPGRADFPHPVLHGRASLTEAWMTIANGRPSFGALSHSLCEEPSRLHASAAIHCRVVYRLAGFMSPPLFPANGPSARRLPSLLRVPASPVPRSPRYYEGATTSHARICARLWFRSRSPPDPSGFRVRRSAPKGAEGPLQARALDWPATRRSGAPRVDAQGISQVFRRSVPCLCSVPRPRPNRCVLAIVGHIDAAPALRTAKASGNG